MAYPSNSPQRWAFDASADTADPGAFADIGFVADDPARYDWLNYTLENHGEWLTYLEDIAPSDGVLRFREWECPDNAAFSLEWSGSTDGRMDATLSVLNLTANDASSGVAMAYDALGTSAQIQLTGVGATLQSTVAGSSAEVRSANSAGTEGARVECHVDDRDIDIVSSDGNVTISAGGGAVDVTGDVDITGTVTGSSSASFVGNVVADRFQYQSATTFSKSWCPSHFADVDGSGTSDVTAFFAAGWVVSDPGSLTDGDVLCWGLLGSLEPVAYGTGVPTQVRVFWRQAAGSDGVTIELVSVTAGGSETVVASGDLPDGTSGNQSTVLGSLAGSINISETFFVRASSKGGSAANVKVFGLDIQYTRTETR